MEPRFALLDASVLYAGLVGTGASAILVATVRLGGLSAFTTENAMEETRRHRLAYFNSERLKLHATEADRELKALRESPTFAVEPWVTAPPSLWPENRKDAYLIEAAQRFRPRFLLTLDHGLLAREFVGDTVIASPALVLNALDIAEEESL